MKAIIVGNGSVLPDKKWIEFIKRFNLIIAADGGANFLQALEILPHVLIGDLDSIDEKIKKIYQKNQVEMKLFPKDKDYTDTWLSIDYALEKDPEELALFNVTGTRLDHTLGSLSLLNKLLEKNTFGYIIDDTNQIFLIKDRFQIKNRVGETVSLLPFTDEVILSAKGFKWEISDALIKKTEPIGVSNVIEKEEAEILVKKGQLFVLFSSDTHHTFLPFA